MENNIIRKVDVTLGLIATHYMDSYQGDILYDHQTIINTLDEKGEIELYVATTHFDTEKRFQYDNDSVQDARSRAREMHWGDYIVTLKVKDGDLYMGVESDNEKGLLKDFPMDRFGDEFNADYIMWDKRTSYTYNNVTKHGVYSDKRKGYVIRLEEPIELNDWGGEKVKGYAILVDTKRSINVIDAEDNVHWTPYGAENEEKIRTALGC